MLDVDQHGIDGEAALASVEEQLGPLPQTVEQRTGSGGRQLLFRYPDGREMRNKAGRPLKEGQRGALPPGLDSRGQGGFVVVPPSVHPCGDTYRWTRGPHEAEPAELPDAWVKWLERRPHVTISVAIRPLRNVSEQSLEPLLRFIASQGQGNRNAGLYWAARKAEQLRRLGLIRRPVDDQLVAAARDCGLDHAETVRTIGSAKRAEGER